MKKQAKKMEKPVFEKYAIFQSGGKQYQAIPGKTVAVEKLKGNEGDAIEFSEVLFRKTGENAYEIGQPFVQGAVLKGSIVKHDKDAKVVVFRFKRRKKCRVKKGHRQPHTVVRIESI
jgi:large subunit ribosomal protein L21